ncbi:MAG TPA: HD-GYP domain-containing protein [Bacillota bacterium]|nr:HD-GYP domain-containing protein [Bacillota bacterium]
MKKLPIKSIRPGMKVSQPVYDSFGNVLLESGITLTRHYIGRLLKHGIRSVYVEDSFLPDAAPGDVISDQTRQKAISQVKNLFMEASEGVIIGIDEIQETVGSMVNQLSSNESIVNMLDQRSLDDYTFYHSVNVCVLSIMTGITMGYDEKDLHILGTGAILHDLGKTKIPKEILNKSGRLTDEEFAIIKMHPAYGYELIKQTGEIDEIAALISYEHHERYNGSGYPEGKRNSAIHRFSRIVSIADTYDAITAERIYKKASQPHEAYEMLAGSGNYLFDYLAVRSFLENIAAYPAGSLVRLTSGETAVVMETPKGFTFLPRVNVIIDSAGRLLKEPRELRLYEMENAAVQSVLTEEEFENLLKRAGN